VEAPGSAETVVTIYETTGCKRPPPPHPVILHMLDFLSWLIWEPPHFYQGVRIYKNVLKTNFVEEVFKGKFLFLAISFSCVNHSLTVHAHSHKSELLHAQFVTWSNKF